MFHTPLTCIFAVPLPPFPIHQPSHTPAHRNRKQSVGMRTGASIACRQSEAGKHNPPNSPPTGRRALVRGSWCGGANKTTGGGGCPQCRMSILRNGNAPCHYLSKWHVNKKNIKIMYDSNIVSDVDNLHAACWF